MQMNADNGVATMGNGRNAVKQGARFLELKSTVLDRLKSIHTMIQQVQELERSGFGGDNVKEGIRIQAEVRGQIRQASDEWFEMGDIYKKEIRKKRSKFSPEELQIQANLVQQVGLEIGKVKEAQIKGYKQGRTPDAAILHNTTVLTRTARSDAGAALSGNQQQQIHELEERDANLDNRFVEIELGVQDLANIAQLQGEEVRRQNEMLENVNNKVDNANVTVVRVNSRLTKALARVLAGDKFCVKLILIALAICLGAAIYYFAKKKK